MALRCKACSLLFPANLLTDERPLSPLSTRRNQDRSVLAFTLLHPWFRGKGDFLPILFSYSDFRLPMATFARQSSFEYLIEQIALLSRWFRGYSTLKRGRVFTVNGVLNASWNMVNLLSLSEMTTKELNITLAIFILSESWGRVYLSFNTKI